MVTEPVGVGLPVPPATATVTVSGCAVAILNADGFTVTVGALIAGVTVTADLPDALL